MKVAITVGHVEHGNDRLMRFASRFLGVGNASEVIPSVRNAPRYSRSSLHAPYFYAFALLIAALLLAASGCSKTRGATGAGSAGTLSTQWTNELFSFAIANLNHLEDNDCKEMLESMDARLAAMQDPEHALTKVPSNALLASWPEPDMLRQVVSRLNQWVDTLDKPGACQPDPMLKALPTDLAKIPMVTVAELAQVHFTTYDGYALMEADWARDVSRWAKGDTSDDLTAARNLFDWTVRNIQLDEDRPDRPPQVPWETLFMGHGTALERAWVYILLLRQCEINSAVLALPEATTDKRKTELRPWCVAVLVGHEEKKLYLFDTGLGLPIPARKGLSSGKSGELEIMPATLDQVIADPKILDRMAAGPDAPYWASKADVKQAVALIEASPLYLEPRAKRMQLSLNGEQKMVLSTNPTAQASAYKEAKVANSRLWEFPYTTLQSRMAMRPQEVFARLHGFFSFIGLGGGSLYKGRILHLKGRFYDENGAIAAYQRARPRTRDVLAQEMKRVTEYYNMLVAQLKDHGQDVTPQINQVLNQKAKLFFDWHREGVLQGKVNAAYWLGLIEYEQGQYDSAFDYFITRTLQAAGSTVFWESGAHYNMARCREMTGQWQDAVLEYESNASLQRDEGSRLRARWLREVHSKAPADEDKSEKKAANTVEEPKPADEPRPTDEKAAERKVDEKKPDGRKAEPSSAPPGGGFNKK
jgi:hypothetical protein